MTHRRSSVLGGSRGTSLSHVQVVGEVALSHPHRSGRAGLQHPVPPEQRFAKGRTLYPLPDFFAYEKRSGSAAIQERFVVSVISLSGL